MGDHIYQSYQRDRPGSIFFYLDQLKNCFSTATNIIDQCQYVMRYDSSEDSGISDDPVVTIPIVKRLDPSSLRPNFPDINEASTSRSLAYEPTRRRKRQSNSSVHKSVLKRRRESTFDEQSEEDSNSQILGNSFRRPKRKRFLQGKGEESTAAESQNERKVYAQSSSSFYRGQSRDSPEDSTADESQAEDAFPPTVAKSARWKRRDIEELTADESQDEDVFIPTIDKSMQRQRSNLEELTADESEDDEPQFKPFSVKPVKRLRNEIQEESTADESEDEKYELKRRTSVRRRKGHFQVKSGSQNKIKIAATQNTGISKKGRRGRRKTVNVDDTSQDETLLTELEDQQTEEESNVPNLRNLYGKSKRKLTLQNKRDEIDSQEELSADDSQSELKSPFSFKSIRMLRSGSQENLTADESQNDQLGIEDPTSVKKRKRCSQIESKKSVNRNTGTSRRGRSRGKVVSANDAFHEETLISENKTPLNKLIVKCHDILIDPSFESDPVVKKFKDKLLHCNSPRGDEGSDKGKTDEILDEVKDQESSKNQDSEDKNPDTEDMNDSFEETPSAPFGSDSVKTTVPSYIGTSRRGRRGRRRALSVDDSSQDETFLNHLNVSEKEDVHPTTHELLSDIDSEKVFDSTDIEQWDKPEKELNEGEADDVVVETESNADEIKGIDADYDDEGFKTD